MGSYAPLFCNANHKAWPVNLINFDSYRWFGLPGYYVQKMFANNQGTVSLPVAIEKAPEIESPSSKGCIGLGTWLNAAEFKDVEVFAPDGKLLFKPDFSSIDDTWRKTGNGEWSAQDGVLKQSAITPGVTIFMGDSTWTEYTITLKAKRLSGENGFQVYFLNRKNHERYRWDLGGWGNSLYYLESGMRSESMPGNIETGRWYNVKIEIKGNTVKGYLDGNLIQEITESEANIKSLCASASRDDQSGDVILKIVNVSANQVNTQINLNGSISLTGKGEAIVLTSNSPLDENTLENPTKVSPKAKLLKFTGTNLKHSFPGNSLTVIRLTTTKERK
jgi:alpha-L-arabinofuranosidase